MSHTHKLRTQSYTIIKWSAILVAAGMLAQSSRAALPYTDNFEGYAPDSALDGQGQWTAGSGVKAQSTTTLPGSTIAAYIPSESAATNTTGATPEDHPTKVWIDMYVQPTIQSAYATDLPTVDADAAAFFFFNSNGHATVMNGSTWQTNDVMVGSATEVKVTEGTWTRVTVFQNYDSDKWALYVNDRLVGELLGFHAAGTQYESFALRNGTYVDNVWVNNTFPTSGDVNGTLLVPDPDADNDGSEDVWELHYWDTASAYSSGADPDNDGRRNEEEWATGSDPTVTGDVIWDVPYFQMFEVAATTLSGTWRGLDAVAGSGGSVTIESSADLQGSRVLALSTATVSFAVSSTDINDTNIWVQIYTKPGVYYDDGGKPTPAADTAASFYVKRVTSGDAPLMMYSAGGWVPADGAVKTVPTNQWLGFAVHLDYINEEWDLYVSTGGTYGAVLERANLAPLSFNGGYTGPGSFEGFEVDTELPAYLDAVAVSPGYELCSATETNLIVQERLAAQAQYHSLPPKDYTGENTLDDLLGADLSRGLKRNNTVAKADRVQWYDSGTSTWQGPFNLDAGGSWVNAGETADNGSAIIVDRRPGADYAVFYPYVTNLSSEVYSQPIYPTPTKWTLLAFPSQSTPKEMVSGVGDTWGFPDPENWDQIWIYRSPRYINVYYSPIDGIWKRGAAPAKETLYPGESFWYYRTSITGGTWNPPM